MSWRELDPVLSVLLSYFERAAMEISFMRKRAYPVCVNLLRLEQTGSIFAWPESIILGGGKFF
jgi:hypothetical protein